MGLEEVSDFFFEMHRKETDEYKAAKAQEYCDIAEETIALLKEQQQQIWELQDQVEYLTDKQNEQEHSETFIVIDSKTGEEADTYDIALHEDWAKHLCYCDMEGWAIEEDGTLLLVDECGRFAYADRERFKVKWDD